MRREGRAKRMQRESKMSKLACRAWYRASMISGIVAAVLFAGAYPEVSMAQGGKMPMPGMPTPQDTLISMKGMTGTSMPFGVMIGQAGQWMVGYQYMFEKSEGLLDGGASVTEASVLDRFQTAPIDMTMQSHMGMIMYAPANRFTTMAMLPYIDMSMGELHRDGTTSTERSKGIGDLELRGLYSLYAAEGGHHRVLVSFGVGLPTGSIDHADAAGARLEYPMQTGSGTFSLLPGFTYMGEVSPWSWGTALSSTVRVGTNSHGYRTGNRYETNTWAARSLASWVSLSVGARGELWKNTHGSDSILDPADEPTKDSQLQGGKRVDAILGATIHLPSGFFKDQQFLIQGDLPIMQSLSGPQMKRRYMLQLSWQRGL